MKTAGVLLSLVLGLASGQLALAQAQVGLTAAAYTNSALPSEQEWQTAKQNAKDNPNSAQAHYALGELWRRAGKKASAAAEYLQATKLDPHMYVAYHQLAAIDCDAQTSDQAIASLNKAKEQKPKEILLRVALSELLEKRGKYYQAARVLVDLVYQNAVYPRYQAKINARIHHLLAKAKEAQDADQGFLSTEETDTLPPALPESTPKRSMAAVRGKDARIAPGVGHVPLLP